MKRIGAPIDKLETAIQIEVTLRELLNIYAAVANTAPNDVTKYLQEFFDISCSFATEIKKSPYGYYKDDYGKEEHLVTYGLSEQIRQILKDYGYKGKR